MSNNSSIAVICSFFKIIVFCSPYSRIFYHGGRQKTDSDLQLEVLSITQVRNKYFSKVISMWYGSLRGKLNQSVLTFALVDGGIFVHLRCLEYF